MPPKKYITLKKKPILNIIKKQKPLKISLKPKSHHIKSPHTKSHNTKSHQTNQHKYTKYYPSILNPNFTHKIATHPIFKKYKLTKNANKLEELYKAFDTNKPLPDDIKKASSNIYILKPTQKLLRNFMTPYTPYRSLLIYHEMGVGKTCSAITIAESLKSIVANSNTKIYVIHPDEIERQIFNINVVKDGNSANQCTGDTYLQNPAHTELIERCQSGNEYSCNQLSSKIEKDIKNIYQFTGGRTWASKVEKDIEMKTKGIENIKDKENKEKQIISNMFDNSVIIVDEAHSLHSNNENDKQVPKTLNKVLEHASNLRIIFLTATPIYDKPQNIISIINYFLRNDKRPIMKENDVFDKLGNLKPNGRKILEENTRGYVSYLRGNNPFEFPIRLSAKYNIPNEIFNLNKYPKLDIKGKPLEKMDSIKYLELVDSPLKGSQLELFNYHMKNDSIPDINEYEMDELNEIDELEELDSVNDVDADSDISTNTDDTKSSSKKSSSLSSSSKKSSSKTSYVELSNQFAYSFEIQLSNFIYQSLDECNQNLKLSVGAGGLNQIARKQHGNFTYEFINPDYGKRFKLPELEKWGSKIAKVVDRVMNSTGPVFIYTKFISSGIIPIAFALEMNGYKRYQQHGTPILENKYKDNTYRGDYIIYTGDQSMSAFAKEYLDKRRNMIYENKVKVFIGTSKASEGLNLFGYREVHIIDPWHNINLTEQSIGRVIRTGSHLHLPPQERNVSVYQYATTLEGRESIDLKIYKICENKAVKAGVVEKILKENALDCELNKDVNSYDAEHYNRLIPLTTSNKKHIKISLADVEYSRSCFYMKDCKFKCTGETGDTRNHTSTTTAMQIMKFNFDKDIDEFRNLIIQLMQSSFNIKIVNLKEYLKKFMSGTLDEKTYIKKPRLTLKSKSSPDKSTVWEDEEAFDNAIQDIINTDTISTDKFGRKGKIVVSGEYLRFIPEGGLEPNISIQKQHMKTPNLITEINLKGYIHKMDDTYNLLQREEALDYDNILSKNIIEKAEQIFYGTYASKFNRFNITTKMDEIIDLEFSKLIYSFKLIIIKSILEKYVKGIKLKDNDKKIEHCLKKHIIYLKDIFPDTKQDVDSNKNIYGFMIQNINNLELFYLNTNKIFEKNLGNLKKVIENKLMILNKTPANKLYGFIKYEKANTSPVFKITDIFAKGEKKSVKGITCNNKNTNEIKKNLNKLDDKVLRNKNASYTKSVLCNDIEVILKRNDTMKKDGKKWYYSPEEYYMVFESGS